MTTPDSTAHSPHPVIVLHGWGMSAWVTRYWCGQLKRAGFAPLAVSYASVRSTMASNVAHIAAQVERLTGRFTERLAEDQPVHFVGHSLGGIMIMQTLAQHPVANVGRVVMVGTPFQGSAPANNLQKRRWGQAVLGKTIVEWAGVKAENLPPGLQVGTIAGTRAFGMGSVFTRLQHPHDGTVSLAETHVPFATDRLTLHVTHTEMLMSSAVTAPMARFLHTAKFSIGQ